MPTTFSFAIRPVMAATALCQLPQPRGAKIQAIALPITARMRVVQDPPPCRSCRSPHRSSGGTRARIADSRMTVPAFLIKDQARSHMRAEHIADRRPVIGRKLHDKRSGIPCKHLGLFQHNAGNDNGGNTDKIGAGRHPPGSAEQRAGNQGNDRQLCAAGNKGGGHNRHAAVALVFNGTGGHNAGNAAAGADQHRDKGFAGKAEFAENPVHDKGDTRHIAAGFQKRQEDKQHQHLRNKSKHGADAADNTVQNQSLQPIGAVDRIQARLPPEPGMPGTHTPYSAGSGSSMAAASS